MIQIKAVRACNAATAWFVVYLCRLYIVLAVGVAMDACNERKMSSTRLHTKRKKPVAIAAA